MKKALAVLCLGTIILCGYVLLPAKAENKATPQVFEYATIRWGGRENTHVIRPNGDVEALAPLFVEAKRREKGERFDERALLMNVAVNAMAKQGFELAAMTDSEMVMKRPIALRQ